MKFSYSEVWTDTVELLRSNAAIVIALAGVFLFLPTLIVSHFLPAPAAQELGELVELWREYFAANWHWLLLSQLVTMVGTIATLLLILDSRGRSVGALISASILLLPFFFLATLMTRLAIFVGLLLLIVPGLYLIGRLVLVPPVLVAEDKRNPLTAISRSFELTRGKGWAVLGLILLVAIAGTIIAAVLGMLLGIVFLAVAGDDLGTLLTRIVQALASAAIGAIVTVLVAAIYRRLAAAGSTSAAKSD